MLHFSVRGGFQELLHRGRLAVLICQLPRRSLYEGRSGEGRASAFDAL